MFIQVENVSNQLEEVKRGYEEKLDRNARLLDARAARIKVGKNMFCLKTLYAAACDSYISV